MVRCGGLKHAREIADTSVMTRKYTRSLFRPEFQMVLMAALFTLIINCSSSVPAIQPRTLPAPPVVTHDQQKQPPATLSLPPMEEHLRMAVHDWAGTPHRMGGKSRKGIDCSGFIQRIYRDIFKIRLPRTTALQVRTGSTVAKADLQAGDLVFFHPPNKIRHVGIYLGDGEFAHASTTRGVTISSLDAPYWRSAYWTAKRILPDRL